jgi:hypothetical protein
MIKKYTGFYADIYYADLKKNPLGYQGRLLLKRAERQRHLDAMPIFTMEQEFAIVDLRERFEQQLKIAIQKSIGLKSDKNLKQEIKKLKTHLKTLEILNVPYVSHDEIERELREGTIPQEKTFDYSIRTKKILKLLKNYEIDHELKQNLLTTNIIISQNEKNLKMIQKQEQLKQKLSLLTEKFQDLKIELKLKNITTREDQRYNTLSKNISNCKKAIAECELTVVPIASPKVKKIYSKKKTKKIKPIVPIEPIQKVHPSPYLPIIYKKPANVEPLRFDNLNFIMQWELAPIIVSEKCNRFVPGQVEDLHAFILGNYSLSKEDTFKIPIQTLLVQFLFYLIERENSSVRIENLSDHSHSEKNISLEGLALECLTDMNAWKRVHHLVNKNLGFNKDIKQVSLDASLADTYLTPVVNSTNSLSIDGLGNFLQLFKARIEWVSKSNCTQVKIKDLLLGSKNFMNDQVTVITNLKLKQCSWLEGHKFLVNWVLPNEITQHEVFEKRKSKFDGIVIKQK